MASKLPQYSKETEEANTKISQSTKTHDVVPTVVPTMVPTKNTPGAH